MKTLLFVLTAIIVAPVAQANSTQAIASALKTPILKELERRLAAEGYELKSVTDIDAGQYSKPKCACSTFDVVFARSSIERIASDQVLWKVSQRYRLTLDHLKGAHQLVLVQELTH